MPRQIVPSTTSTVAISDSVDLTAAPTQRGLVCSFQANMPPTKSLNRTAAVTAQTKTIPVRINIIFIFNINRVQP